MPSLQRYRPTKLCDGAQMVNFLHPVFPVSHVQHISELHSKFALMPHHVWKYGRHPFSDPRIGEEKKRRKKKKPQE